MSSTYHESNLSEEYKDTHRALVSLQEELEAIDWYGQRMDASGNAEVQAVLAHNRKEEIEHAAMLLEWLRRRDADFDKILKTYLFTSAPITEIEEAEG